MPCRSDYMQSPPSGTTVVKNDKLEYYKNAEAIACAFMRHLEKMDFYKSSHLLGLVADAECGLTKFQFDEWFKHHKEIDAYRKQQEVLEKEIQKRQREGRIKQLKKELERLETEDI